jgi:ABC-2 type transport system permease protein
MFRAIYIMWLRQMKRFVRSRARVLASIAQPVLFLLSLGFGFGSVFQRAGQGNYIEFLGPGIIAMSIVFTAVFSGMEVIWDRQFGFLKETLVAPVPRLSIMLGRTFGGATVAVIQGALVLVIASAIGFRPASWALVLPALLVMALVSIIFTALGTAVASFLRDFQGFQLVMNFLVMPIFFLSGALFPIDGVPTAMLWVVRFDPLAYGVDALRALLINTSHFGLAMDLAVLIPIAVVLLALGGYLFRKIEA